jgi:Family of unknown function (DUF6065)
MTTVPYVSFYRLIDDATLPRRADRSAGGILPTRATRYCEAVTSATAFGWWLFAPMDFSVIWDGAQLYWHYGDQPDWLPLDTAQFPSFSKRFDSSAPEYARGCAPPFLTVLPEPGALQIWTGLFSRTAPDWSLLLRSPANLPLPAGYVVYEGILETDQWFGPLFVNLRFTRTGTPVRFRNQEPLAQVQPLPRQAYAEEILNSALEVPNLESWQPQDWKDYDRDIIQPNSVAQHQPGRYATAVRRRRKSGCPYAAAAA